MGTSRGTASFSGAADSTGYYKNQGTAQNIEVVSLRNKTNRLEELFVSLVEKNLAKVAV